MAGRNGKNAIVTSGGICVSLASDSGSAFGRDLRGGQLLYSILLSFAMSLFIGSAFLDIFAIKGSWLLLTCIGGAVCAGENLLFSMRGVHARYISYARAAGFIAPGLAAAVLALAFGERFLSGFGIVANAVFDAFGSSFGRIYPQFTVSAPAAEYALCTNLFLTVIAIACACVAVYLVRSYNSILGVILLCGLSVMLTSFSGRGTPWAVPAFAALACFFVSALLSRSGGRYVRVRRALPRRALIVALSCAAAVSVVVTSAATLLQVEDTAAGASQSALKVIERLRYGEGSGSLPRGDFLGLGDRETKPGTVRLEIFMSNPDSLWFRGFVGDRYDGSGWSDIPAEDLYGNAELFSRLHKGGFYGQTQLASAAAVAEGDAVAEAVPPVDTAANVSAGAIALTTAAAPDAATSDAAYSKINVNNVGESSKYIFAPYELLNADGSMLDENGIGDAALRSEGLRGNRYCEYTALPNIVKRYPQLAAVMAGAQDSERALQYRAGESHYSGFVYDNYIQIPESTRVLLGKYLGQYDAQREGHPSYSSVKQKILEFLSGSVVYSETIIPPGGGADGDEANEAVSPYAEGTDFLQTFIEKSRLGYDVHYATAATLMFRYYGIPARYVEGYLITPQDADGAVANSLFSLDDTHSHAWSEFYLDGMGWVPFEASPAWMDVMEQPDDISGSAQGEGAGAWQAEADESAVSGDENLEQSEHMSFGFADPAIRPLLLILLAAAALLLVVIFLKIRKKRLALRRRLRLFVSEDTNEAAQAIFAYALELLSAIGLKDKNLSLFERVDEISRAAGCKGDDLLPLLLLHREARFGRRQLTRDELSALRSFMKRALRRLKAVLPWTRRLKLRLIDGLY